VNPAAGDLHLRSTATTVIDRGINNNIVEVTHDIDGQVRPQGIATDIGADEYSSAPAAPILAPPSNLVLK